MLRGMYSSVSAMINLQASQEVISNNMANINTTGYKSEHVISKTFEDMMLSNKDRYLNGKGRKQNLGVLNPGVRIDKVSTDYSQGLLVETNNNTDFSIEGKGFFTIKDNNGNTRYSRDGGFKIDNSGYLVNSSGYQVMGINKNINKLEAIRVGNSKITMDKNNNILLDSKVRYKFKIVDFADYNALKKAGQNLIDGENPTTVNDYKIRNGCKEKSNVDIIDVTSSLMVNLRAFEANQKVVQIMDSTLSKMANEIGNVR
ncbi:flagellar hook-basal body complex protein [Clostridium sardiniense]|uniref:Flagellar hook-basal body complex protein n=1 Tax=Clostridium sardiniense TaxID=29369 RepID=A0ABS7KV09_CLOSR|nr:flagellar hook-basal body complex protein [Clostridium sardiniense]MBY0754646.1 flagellar hook-basal body complex protein [Clostridium sardiniense]MDQ0460634.1 flagellar basal-body rod protein FlgG [Clostridium sardiniense]